MKKTIDMGLYSWLIWGCTQKRFTSATTGQSPATRLLLEGHIQQIVCFKFKPGITQEDINQHMRGFAGLKDSISYILS